MIDFSLSPEQQQVRAQAAGFAAACLKDARAAYSKLPNDGISRFQSTKGLFEVAVKGGLIKSLVPQSLGGTGGTLVDSAIITEELFAVEPSIAINLLTINLGLMPLFFTQGKDSVVKETISPFLSQEGAPLAALLYSEPTGSANWLEVGGKGLQTTIHKDGQDWVLNGEKVWAGNSAGWDEKGGDVQTIVCRDSTVKSTDPRDAVKVVILTRATIDSNASSAFQVVQHKITPGFTACSGPHVRYTDIRIPGKYVLAEGKAAVTAIEMAFTASATMVGAMGVGMMRAAFDFSLAFAKKNDMGGTQKLLERQTVADLLISIKIRAETSRLLSWKAADALDKQMPGAADTAFAAKIYGSESAVESVTEAMRAVGVTSYSDDAPLVQIMADALVLPIFDGGNQGVRRRQIQACFLQDDYQAWQCAFGQVKKTSTHTPPESP